MQKNIQNITAVIEYIEAHLTEKLDLDTIADAVHYSKYHLHRMFADMTGLTVHDYIQRRRLTEAAKLLVFSDKPILEIALLAGYESQRRPSLPKKPTFPAGWSWFALWWMAFPAWMRKNISRPCRKKSVQDRR